MCVVHHGALENARCHFDDFRRGEPFLYFNFSADTAKLSSLMKIENNINIYRHYLVMMPLDTITLSNTITDVSKIAAWFKQLKTSGVDGSSLSLLSQCAFLDLLSLSV